MRKELAPPQTASHPDEPVITGCAEVSALERHIALVRKWGHLNIESALELIDRQARQLNDWREFGVIDVMVRNKCVDEFVRQKEGEVASLWRRIKQMADQTDPKWAHQLAKDTIAEREV